MRFYITSGFLFFLFLTSSAQGDPLNSLQECRQRGGLPNFFYKLEHGGPVTIAYLGGSITAAKDGWRDQSLNWFQKQYPGAKLSQVNAGVGGTGSDLGAFRVGRDVISHDPDLVFVEFAVNDGGAARERIYNAMEGIVRQIWRHHSRTDICFVYTLSGQMVPTLQKGELWSSMLAMEQIAQYYKIPSIQFGVSVIGLINEGKLVFQGKEEEYRDKIVFSNDNVHPLPRTGHRLYTEALIRSMEGMKGNARRQKHHPGKPFSPDNWEDATMISLDHIQKEGSWKHLTAMDTVFKDFVPRFPYLYASETPGSSFTIHFRGRVAGIFDIIGPSVGQLAVQVDNAPSKLYNRFDKYCTYYHFNYFLLPALAPGEHTLTFSLSPQAPDKMAILKNGNGVPGDPAQYRPNACYIGWVLLIGRVEK